MRTVDRRYSAAQIGLKYAHYYYHALNGQGHGIHSPFVYDFVRNVLNNTAGYKVQKEIEVVRRKFQNDHTSLQIEDFGAGNNSGIQRSRKVKDIAASSLKSQKYAELLFRTVAHYKPKMILELGTSLGITTAYMSAANPKSSIHTIEGSSAIGAQAQKGWTQLGCQNITLHTGNFDDLLPGILPRLQNLDLVYVDGNHRKEATLQYFDKILPFVHENTVLVFDDIHWSPGMEEAWSAICKHPSVRYSVDIFFLGFIFFRKEFLVKQHFVIRY